MYTIVFFHFLLFFKKKILIYSHLYKTTNYFNMIGVFIKILDPYNGFRIREARLTHLELSV